ncbi:MAG: hypothetical protein ACRDV4_01175 [Acidimicrobiales bacterium]
MSPFAERRNRSSGALVESNRDGGEQIDDFTVSNFQGVRSGLLDLPCQPDDEPDELSVLLPLLRLT